MDYVDVYIKAFYLQPDELLQWARSHPEYTVRHLTGLVSVSGMGAQLKKNEQQKLIASLQEVSDHRRDALHARA